MTDKHRFERLSPEPTQPKDPTRGNQHTFGNSQPWESEEYAERLASWDCWPTTDLATRMLDFFFDRINPVMPLIQESAWRRCVSYLLSSLRKLVRPHLTRVLLSASRIERHDFLVDSGFANVCLMVGLPRVWTLTRS